MAILLDTNVVSELRKSSPNAAVLSWFETVPSEDVYLSVLVLGEIRQGIEQLKRRGDEPQASRFEVWLESVESTFAERTVPVTTNVADQWGRLNAIQPLPLADGLMAATALTYDWIFATRNAKDVERTGVR